MHRENTFPLSGRRRWMSSAVSSLPTTSTGKFIPRELYKRAEEEARGVAAMIVRISITAKSSCDTYHELYKFIPLNRTSAPHSSVRSSPQGMRAIQGQLGCMPLVSAALLGIF